jgi:hypothetical protein
MIIFQLSALSYQPFTPRLAQLDRVTSLFLRVTSLFLKAESRKL